MKTSLIVTGVAAALAVAGWMGWSADQLHRKDQLVLARWAEVHAAEQTQFAEVPVVLALVDQKTGLDPGVHAGARARCGSLGEFDNAAALIDDPQRFDRYKQVRAECTGTLFRLLAAAGAEPAVAQDPHVQSLRQSLTRGQADVDAARERYRQALQAYNAGVQRLPTRVAAAVLGYQERPDFVRWATMNS